MRKCRILLCVPLLFTALLSACNSSASGSSSSPEQAGQAQQAASSDSGSGKDDTPLRDNTPQVLVPAADGTVTYSEADVTIDASHTDQGYIMIQYTGSDPNERVQINSPDGSTYNYILGTDGSYETFPLSCGDGTYTVTVYQCVSVSDGLYSTVISQDFTITGSDEFLPFLYPNQYVNFDAGYNAVAKAKELAATAHSDMDVVEAVFFYIAENISYDTDKAASVSYGYLPSVDSTLASGTGICFDYASLMASMLRSQGIPTKLEIGYVGEIYHAWISTYVDEAGWIQNIIQFDGTSWTLIDPTYSASTNGTQAAKDGEYMTLLYY